MPVGFTCSGLLNWHAKNKSDFKVNLGQVRAQVSLASHLLARGGVINFAERFTVFQKHFARQMGLEPHASFVRSGRST